MEKKEHQKHKASHLKTEPVKKSSEKSSGLKDKITNIYDRHYRKMMIIPNILLVLSLGILFFNLFTTGQFIEKGVSLSGGVSMTILSPTIDNVEVQELLKEEYSKADVESRTITGGGQQKGIIVEVAGITSEELQSTIVSQYGLSKEDYTIEVTGSSLGKSFYKQLIIAILIAFVLMGTVVYIYYRSIVPSLAIILAAFSNMITTLAIISLMGVKITPAGIAGFLMLLGFSVDTDILLTTRALKHKGGTVDERMFSALKTGLTMSAAAIASISISLIFTHSETIKQIMTILLIGLIFDLVYTWIQNAGIIKMYLEKRGEAKNE